jgi:hypothetical protein
MIGDASFKVWILVEGSMRGVRTRRNVLREQLKR